MAIISSYTIGTPTVDDYLIGTDDPGGQGPTKNFTLQSIINLVSSLDPSSAISNSQLEYV